MGKKTKTGKQRKDKFYKLAKETGFRSRASFKLIQLNRKFEFLQTSRILIDLCAAPGGWLQVAQQSMPVSSLIIGVDLVSIRPIPNVITLQEDITTEKCRQALKKQIKTWKADVVLHDGAPNVGKSWVHDAFTQIQLTLSALKLATDLLMPNGWFITKVFRSKEYNNLLWVFQKLFKKVHVTKPQASRNESAEIFVVCQGYLAPDRIDPRFLDSSSLFKDVEEKTDIKSLLQPSKKKPKAEGYDDGDSSVFYQLKASDFILGDNHLELLAKCNKIVFDDEDIRDHRLTTPEIKEHCEDIKVLGKGELRAILNWRKALLEIIKKQDIKLKNGSLETSEEKTVEELEIEDAVKEAENIELEKYQELKRKKKKILKEKRKTTEKINLKMIIKDDEPIIQEDLELFNLSAFKNKKDLSKVEINGDMDLGAESENEDNENEPPIKRHKSNFTTYNRFKDREMWEDEASKPEEIDSDDEDNEELEFSVHEDNKSDDEVENEDTLSDNEENPLLVDLVDKDVRVADTVNKWFDKDDFAEVLQNDDDNDLELELLAENMEKQKSAPYIPSVVPQSNLGSLDVSIQDAEIILSEDENNSLNVAEDKENENNCALQNGLLDMKDSSAAETDPKPKKKKKKKIILTPEELALGSLMIRSKKMKRDILDNAYNRFSNNDTNLPDWFVKDEEKHNRKQLPVTAEMVAEYKEQLKVINARPIKKVIEAKARKKKRAVRRLEKARKKAEAVTESLDMSEREKAEQIGSIYKKALSKKSKEVTYVVGKRGTGKKVRRPAGVKGRFRVVDPRMKKDDRKRKTELKTNKKKGRNVKPNKKKGRR